MMCDDSVLCRELFMYFDMFYIQWRRLAKKDVWNKVYMIMTLQWVSALKHDCIALVCDIVPPSVTRSSR
jgi:hypothetical protein